MSFPSPKTVIVGKSTVLTIKKINSIQEYVDFLRYYPKGCPYPHILVSQDEEDGSYTFRVRLEAHGVITYFSEEDPIGSWFVTPTAFQAVMKGESVYLYLFSDKGEVDAFTKN